MLMTFVVSFRMTKQSSDLKKPSVKIIPKEKVEINGLKYSDKTLQD